jgi:hypothetical protein
MGFRMTTSYSDDTFDYVTLEEAGQWIDSSFGLDQDIQLEFAE